MKLFYNIFIWLYPLAAKLLGTNNKKAQLWVQGRKNIFSSLQSAFQNHSAKIVWVHCSSLGEFEQGRPLIQNIKSQFSEYKILLTFFSPSGYEVQKNYKGADWIFYLPMDSPSNAKQFLEIVNPCLVLFIKYEFWFYYLNEIKKRNIPMLLISGVFREQQVFFQWYGNLYRKMLSSFTYFFVQNQQSKELLKSIGFDKNVNISGDTRFDRVITIAENFEPINIIESFISDKITIVAGSTWTEDDEELCHYANNHPEIKFIIAPHDIDEERIEECKTLYKNSILYSSIVNNQSSIVNGNVLIIDNIGILSKLYKYATICYVGGGFGDDGVHNVLEAAVYYKPVLFGPEYDKYTEAIELIDANGALTIENALELESEFDFLLNDKNYYEATCKNAGNYVKNKSGATKKIMEYIYANRLLTN